MFFFFCLQLLMWSLSPTWLIGWFDWFDWFVDCNQKFLEFIGYSKVTPLLSFLILFLLSCAFVSFLISYPSPSQEDLLERATFFGITHPDSMASTFSFVHGLLTGPPGQLRNVTKKYITKSGLVVTATVYCWLSLDERGLQISCGFWVLSLSLSPFFLFALCEGHLTDGNM